jgi:hypothetical protein
MNRLVSFLVACACVCFAHAENQCTNAASPAVTTNRCAEFELKDQFDQVHAIKFPSAKPILLTVADKKGSEGIAGWAHPVGVKFGERIQIAGLADVSAVPRPLRGFVQGKFKKAITYPTMLDWEGKISAGFKYEKNRPNIYLVARDGRVLRFFSGEADPRRLEELMAALQAELDSPPAR